MDKPSLPPKSDNGLIEIQQGLYTVPKRDNSLIEVQPGLYTVRESSSVWVASKSR